MGTEAVARRWVRLNWARLSGCACTPEDARRGTGHDLSCSHRHVEVKGTMKKHPEFRLFTQGEYEAAQHDPLWKAWVIADLGGDPRAYRVLREGFIRAVRPEPVWKLPLGKARLARYAR